jgi:hypothetical protein
MKHNREPQRGMLNERPIFVLIRQRAGTQSRTRINAPHDSEQTKSAKKSKWEEKVGPRKRSPNRKPETARLTPSLELRSQHVDYVISGNYAHQLILLIDDREHDQIVLIEQFGNSVVAHILVYPHKR